MAENNRQLNKVAMVTGSAKRVGKAIAEALHKVGYNIVIHCNKSKVEAEALSISFNR